MKILHVNTFFFEGGGDRSYMFRLADIFEKKGHEVAFFAMQHPKNNSSPWSEYFVSQMDFKKLLEGRQYLQAANVVGRSFYSIEAKRKIAKLFADFKPDVVHLHTIHNHISPSILHSAREVGIPVVWTLHNYTVLCANSTFLSHGEICLECKPRRFHKCVQKKCIKGSFLASAVGSMAHYVHYFLGLYELVDRFISPSRFLKHQFVDFGFPEAKITHIPNFALVDQVQPTYQSAGYGVYLGRLSEEKGLLTLMRALQIAKDVPIKIIGEGVVKSEMEKIVKNANLRNIQFYGFRHGRDLWEILQKSSYTVLPSEWFENAPLSILEGFMYGKPAIATNIGGIPEIVVDGENGALFPYRDHIKLASILDRFHNSDDLVHKLGKRAREDAETIYSAENHYSNVLRTYQEVIASPN